MNNDRIKEITAILESLAKYAQINYIDNNFYQKIYNDLKSYNIGDEKNIDIRKNFPSWINRFKSKQTRCENTKDHLYWCQFVNEKYPNQTLKESDPVKLYIPLKSDYVLEGVNKIFDFCEQNNIIHQSKVASTMRNDNVVLRIKEIDDAIKVINFVNNDEYLKQGALKTNPFCFKVGNVGLAIDNKNSYNDNVSKFLANYIMYKKQTKTLNNVSIDGFFDFVACNRLPYSTKEDVIYGDEIRKLILISLKSNEFSDFKEHYYSVLGNSNQDVLKVLDEAIDVTIENHNILFVKEALYSYLRTGSTKGFSRYRSGNTNINYRGRLSSLNYKQVIKQLSDYCGTSDINEIVNKYIKSNTRA